MKGNDISQYDERTSFGVVLEKYNDKFKIDVTDPIVGTPIIESAFYNIHLFSSVYVYMNMNPRSYEIIVQNPIFNAIMNYMNDQYALTGCKLQPRLEGKKFSELERPDQRRINQQEAHIITVYTSGKTTKEEVIEFYKSLLPRN